MLMIDCCPFSVLVRLIAYEVSGGWKDYRNSAGLTKVEVNVSCYRSVGGFFCLCNVSGGLLQKPLCMHQVCVCVFIEGNFLTSVVKAFFKDVGKKLKRFTELF